MKKKSGWLLAGASVIASYTALWLIAKLTEEGPEIDGENPYPAQVQEENHRESPYERIIKPGLDSALSFCGMAVLLPVYAVTAAAVYLDDPGPIFFAQKRVGKNGHYFLCHKFRTMRMDAPHDMPTHMLEKPDQYITRVGKVARKLSIDELPQLWDVYRHKMSLVGPRPALWNQADLIAEREKYGANSVTPGITGLAQINGRDELEIPEKARLDGKYAEKLSFGADLKCLLGTVKAVAGAEGVVEGGTGVLESTV